MAGIQLGSDSETHPGASLPYKTRGHDLLAEGVASVIRNPRGLGANAYADNRGILPIGPPVLLRARGCFLPMSATILALQWFTTRVVDVQRLGRGPSQLLGLLRAHARRTGKAWPRQTTLATELGVSPRTIRRWLRDLEEEGLIDIQRTGRSSVITFPDGPSEGPDQPARSATMTDRIRGEKETGEEDRVSSALGSDSTTSASPVQESPTTTAISRQDEHELPDAGQLRQDLAETREREQDWANVAPESAERRQARERGRALDVRLAWLQDVQRAAERIQRIPGYGYRGDGGVGSLGALWSLRERYGSMGEEWLLSVRAWCAWWSDPKHRGPILSLDRWLARERHDEVSVLELVPLPDPPSEGVDIPDTGEGRGETELTPWQQQVRQWESEGLPVSVAHALEEQEPVDGQIPMLDPLRQGIFEKWLSADQTRPSFSRVLRM